ncbi:hypothetical protein N7509_008117 [Penicillium cosmopolitanum]|uniref:Transcription factor domain-containing protein n=1 Tax=Penicillium cosmopolitanum TaxID=1131564 RepID=A0A9W9W0E1_9EURO|nr:uncharacterized protein N7509_008117 [Penicillium cosmopolitanum]KAJ5392627.1 hypothetical protein N7509_008117 [Penicillium cosmopolitanum]
MESPTPPADKPDVQKRKHSRAAASYPRKRATQACQTCRLKRTKFDSASLAILKRIDDLEALIQTKANDPPPVALPNVLCSSSSSSPNDIWASGLEQQTQLEPCFINIEEVLKWPVFDDHEFDPRLYLLSPSDESTVQPNLQTSVDLDLRVADHLVRSFFDNVHIFNPTLKEEDINEYVRSVQLNGIGWDAMSCLLLLIYANGSITTSFVRNGQGVDSTLFRQSKEFLQGEAYFLAAQKRMGMLLCRGGVIEVQCFFLAGVYLMTTLRSVEAWRMFVQALACCEGFSILRTNDCHEAAWETKQRVYWTCLKSELELRLELNLYQKNFLGLKYPTFFPSPPEELKSRDEAAWYFYLAEIALRRLENRILSYLYQPHDVIAKSNLESVILDFEEQADGW